VGAVYVLMQSYNGQRAPQRQWNLHEGLTAFSAGMASTLTIPACWALFSDLPSLYDCPAQVMPILPLETSLRARRASGRSAAAPRGERSGAVCPDSQVRGAMGIRCPEGSS
jgi:hypothetical protein